MCCYVGKATKIFLCLAAAALVAGLVLGVGLARRSWGARGAQPDCRWPDCQQQQQQQQQEDAMDGGDPLLPATAATTPTNPLTQPAVAAFPGVPSSSWSSSSSPTAAPPAAASVPYFGPPPSPSVVGLGSAAHP
ncbi:hypothetical protein ACP4OV_026208 [Aristida adscensionis]